MSAARTIAAKKNSRPPKCESAAGGRAAEAFTSVVNAGACPCGGGCPRCAGAPRNLWPPAFSGVRFHPAAPEITAPLRARAVTIGQEVYFHPGEFRPGTPEGERLIAHELAHTLQTRQRAIDPGPQTETHSPETLERNADELAAGRTSHPLPAPEKAALPQRFPDEPWYMEVRRLAVLDRYRQLLRQLQSGLETGALLEPVERTRPRDRIQNMFSGRIFSRTERNAIIARLVLNLALLITRLQAAAAPATWDEPQVEGYNLSAANIHDEGDSTITDAATYYAHWSADRGRPVGEAEVEVDYIFALLASATPAPATAPPAPTSAPESTRPREGSPGSHDFEGGHSPVAYIVVDDPKRAPLTYHPAVGGTIPVHGYLADVYYDGRRYYYYYHGRRIDLPDFNFH